MVSLKSSRRRFALPRLALFLPTWGVAALALTLAACQREDSASAASPPAPPPQARQPAAEVPPPQAPPPSGSQPDAGDQAARDAQAKAYYEQLLAQYGQDYEACGPSERVVPGECPPAKDVPGGPAAKPGARGRVLLMLDASGSMAARAHGETRMAAAQAALIGFTRQLAGSADVALRVYGHKGSNRASGKAESCAGSELLYPFQKLDAAAFESAIRSFRPTGWTPLAASLETAAKDFAAAPAQDGANLVYVVSDGIETCGGDPVQAARRLHESGIGVVVNVIGFGVDAEAERQLRAVAQAGGGQYLGAESRADLNRIFHDRWSEAQKRYNCVWDAQQRAYIQTWDAQQQRFNCLWGKAQSEMNAVRDAASRDYNHAWQQSQTEYMALWDRLQKDASLAPDQRKALQQEAAHRRDSVQALARAKRDYATTQVKAKGEGIQAQAREERERVQGDARREHESAQQAARQQKEQAQEEAKHERDAGAGR
ncbi:VWA domain-containing protein [Ottowia sp.]|uniref:vWA domain-containing protein n=1 Tax=Ottowia sp. TaxID=1898956 RepID=UPI0039E34F0D